MSKQEQYRKLCLKVKEHYQNNRELFEELGLTWVDSLDEMNLWTCWQGKGNLDNKIKILLVGQDWGPAHDTAKEIELFSQGVIKCTDTCTTDKNLVELFTILGYDILAKNDKNKELFFTNIIPYYRTGKKYSGNYKSKWMHEEIRGFFKELVEITQPKIIICLGQVTYLAAMKSLAADAAPKSRFKTHAQMIDNGATQLNLANNHQVYVIPCAHCGGLGTRNRKFDQQKLDWENIKPLLE